MKKNIFAILLIAVLVFSFAACGKNKENNEDTKEETKQTEVKEETNTEETSKAEKEEPTEFIDSYDFEKKVDELNSPGISEERKEELLAEIQAILEQVEKNQQ